MSIKDTAKCMEPIIFEKTEAKKNGQVPWLNSKSQEETLFKNASKIKQNRYVRKVAWQNNRNRDDEVIYVGMIKVHIKKKRNTLTRMAN